MQEIKKKLNSISSHGTKYWHLGHFSCSSQCGYEYVLCFLEKSDTGEASLEAETSQEHIAIISNQEDNGGLDQAIGCSTDKMERLMIVC